MKNMLVVSSLDQVHMPFVTSQRADFKTCVPAQANYWKAGDKFELSDN